MLATVRYEGQEVFAVRDGVFDRFVSGDEARVARLNGFGENCLRFEAFLISYDILDDRRANSEILDRARS